MVAAAHAHVRDVAEQKQVVNFRRQQGICRLELRRRDTEGLLGGVAYQSEDSVHNGCQLSLSALPAALDPLPCRRNDRRYTGRRAGREDPHLG